MEFAYLNKEDLDDLRLSKRLKVPFILVEANDQTKVEYYEPDGKMTCDESLSNLNEQH